MPETLMPPYLPAYEPPSHRRTSLAVGLAPLIVLLVFTGIVIGWVPADIGLASLLACTLWVAHEMHGFQRAVDAYNADYVERHLQWRRSDSIAELIDSPATDEPARAFAARFLAADRVLLPDGRLP
ncbi:MAG: hypothetical protein ACKO3M_11085 [Rubrivivax sp.]